MSAYFAAASTDDLQGAAIHWKVDDEHLYIGVAARATGWISFGIAEAGGMKGADLVLFEMSNPGKLTDAYVMEERQPLTDDSQDWTFIDSRSEGGFLIFEGLRKLDTNDVNDHAIMNDTDSIIPAQRVIAAWGDSDSLQYHGKSKARGGLRWFGDGDDLSNFQSRMANESDGFFDTVVGNYSLKAIETDHFFDFEQAAKNPGGCSCFTRGWYSNLARISLGSKRDARDSSRVL